MCRLKKYSAIIYVFYTHVNAVSHKGARLLALQVGAGNFRRRVVQSAHHRGGEVGQEHRLAKVGDLEDAAAQQQIARLDVIVDDSLMKVKKFSQN